MSETERKLTGIRLPRSIRVKLGIVALERGVSLNDLFVQAAADWYNRQPEAAKYGAIPADDVQPQKRGPKGKDSPSSETD